MVCHIFCSSLSHVGIAVFAFHSTCFISSFTPLSPAARKSRHSFTHSVPFRYISLSGYMLFHSQINVVAAKFRFATFSFTTTHITPFRSFRYHSTTFALYFQPLPYPTHRSSKKMRQTSCRQHPATAPCATCVRGIRSTRIGSRSTHRLHTSFRFSTLAFALLSILAQGCFYQEKFGLNLLLPRQPPATHP